MTHFTEYSRSPSNFELPDAPQEVARSRSFFLGCVFVFGLLMACFSQVLFNVVNQPIGDVLEICFFLVYPLALVVGIVGTSTRNAALLYLLLFASIMFVGAINSFELGNARFLMRYFLAFLGLSLIFLVPYIQLTEGMQRLIRFSFLVAAMILSSYALTQPPLVIIGDARLAAFAGGPDGLHPSAYTALGVLCVMVLMGTPTNRIGWLFQYSMIALLVVVLLGFDVRTVYFMAFFIIALGYFFTRPPGRRDLVLCLAIPALMVVVAVSVVILDGISPENLTSFSSGRTANYLERVDVIFSRDIFEFLVGSGPGTDLFRGSTYWRYELKNSHNDVLTTIIEFGVIGIALVIGIFCVVYQRLSPLGRALFLAFLATSLISNGLILRPSSAGVFIFALALWESGQIRRRGAE